MALTEKRLSTQYEELENLDFEDFSSRSNKAKENKNSTKKSGPGGEGRSKCAEKKKQAQGEVNTDFENASGNDGARRLLSEEEEEDGRRQSRDLLAETAAENMSFFSNSIALDQMVPLAA